MADELRDQSPEKNNATELGVETAASSVFRTRLRPKLDRSKNGREWKLEFVRLIKYNARKMRR